VLELRRGDRVLHIGCGLGYYTAIIATVIAPHGEVIGVELDAALASRAAANLTSVKRVNVLAGDGCQFDPGPVDAILVNAGATHPRSRGSRGCGLEAECFFRSPTTLGLESS
jgi:protein-L-isoaspartate(D-aspartate) O-methyltransferase